MIAPVSVETSRAVWPPALLALAIWREARGASIEAKTAVAFSILNRVARPSWWGKTLAGVLGKKWQYSSLAAPGDPQLILWPEPEDPSFVECLAVARAVLNGLLPNPVPGADSYHDSSIPTPPAMATGRDCGVFASPHGNSLHFWDVDHDFEAPVTGHA